MTNIIDKLLGKAKNDNIEEILQHEETLRGAKLRAEINAVDINNNYTALMNKGSFSHSDAMEIAFRKQFPYEWGVSMGMKMGDHK